MLEAQGARNVDGLRRDELLEGGREHERLEGAPRLAAGVERQVKVILLAGQSLYGPVFGLDARDGAGGVAGAVQGFVDRRNGLLLTRGVEGGVDLEPPVLEGLGSELL